MDYVVTLRSLGSRMLSRQMLVCYKGKSHVRIAKRGCCRSLEKSLRMDLHRADLYREDMFRCIAHLLCAA